MAAVRLDIGSMHPLSAEGFNVRFGFSHCIQWGASVFARLLGNSDSCQRLSVFLNADAWIGACHL